MITRTEQTAKLFYDSYGYEKSTAIINQIAFVYRDNKEETKFWYDVFTELTKLRN